MIYTLVEFVDDNILYITPSKGITPIDENLVWAPYKRMGYYEAKILATDENKSNLIRLMSEREVRNVKDVKLCFSGKNESLILPKCGDINNNQVKDVSKNNLDGKSSAAASSKGLRNSSPNINRNKNENIPPFKKNISNDPQNTKGSKQFMKQNGSGNSSTVGIEVESEKNETKKSHKKHCCLFCKKLVYQIVRHWINIHGEENDVKKITFLHSSNPLRRKRIDRLRGKGDFEYNQLQAQGSDKCIVSRISGKSGATYFPCPTCLRFISKNNLRRHTNFCSPNRGSRHLQGSARKLTHYIHERASKTLRTVITADMFQDDVINQVLFDEILIIYGNFMCIKYNGESHLKNHIRAQLRLLGRFMLRVKVHDSSIECCRDLIHSKNIDTIRKAIDDIAGFDSNNMYKHPTNSRTLLTELKKLIAVVKSESDKAEDDFLMKRAKGLSRRIKQELAPYINRISKNSENSIRRSLQQKRNYLPEKKDIEKYLQSLLDNISLLIRRLQKEFSSEVWAQLAQYLMVYLAAFNRKRPGETQRIELNDFENRQGVSKKDMISLNDNDKLQAHKYVRIGFRGKLGNSTALLIHKTNILPGIKLLLQYRKKAGVHHSNKFLFAKPSHNDKCSTFDAYRSHKQFSENLGINHENFTFTKLRKHFATEVAKNVVSQDEEKRVSNYMSHNFDIHKKIYDHSTTLIDITKVSKHLEVTSEVKKNKKEDENIYKSLVQNKTSRHSSLKRKYNIQEMNIKKNNNNSTSSISSSSEISEKYEGYECYSRRRRGKNGFPRGNHLSRNSSSSSEDGQSSFGRKFSSENHLSLNEASNSENEQPSLEEVEQCLGKYKKRKLWSSMEKKVTRNFFEREILENKIVHNGKVHRFIEKYKHVMVNRSVSMIKQWIECEKWKLEQKAEGVEEKRPRFSTPEKEILEISLERHSLEGSEPSFQELESLSAEHDILKRRSAQSLLKKFKDLKRRKTSSN